MPGKVTVLVGEGDVVDSIMCTVGSEQCDLIVVGTARNELLGRILLGRTVDKPASWRMPRILIEDGPPTVLLRDYVRERELDLVVLSTHGHSAVPEVFIGSMAKATMYEAPCDEPVIRKPRAAVET